MKVSKNLGLSLFIIGLIGVLISATSPLFMSMVMDIPTIESNFEYGVDEGDQFFYKYDYDVEGNLITVGIGDEDIYNDMDEDWYQKNEIEIITTNSNSATINYTKSYFENETLSDPLSEEIWEGEEEVERIHTTNYTDFLNDPFVMPLDVGMDDFTDKDFLFNCMFYQGLKDVMPLEEEDPLPSNVEILYANDTHIMIDYDPNFNPELLENGIWIDDGNNESYYYGIDCEQIFINGTIEIALPVEKFINQPNPNTIVEEGSYYDAVDFFYNIVGVFEVIDRWENTIQVDSYGVSEADNQFLRLYENGEQYDFVIANVTANTTYYDVLTYPTDSHDVLDFLDVGDSFYCIYGTGDPIEAESELIITDVFENEIEIDKTNYTNSDLVSWKNLVIGVKLGMAWMMWEIANVYDYDPHVNLSLSQKGLLSAEDWFNVGDDFSLHRKGFDDYNYEWNTYDIADLARNQIYLITVDYLDFEGSANETHFDYTKTQDIMGKIHMGSGVFLDGSLDIDSRIMMIYSTDKVLDNYTLEIEGSYSASGIVNDDVISARYEFEGVITIERIEIEELIIDGTSAKQWLKDNWAVIVGPVSGVLTIGGFFLWYKSLRSLCKPTGPRVNWTCPNPNAKKSKLKK